MPTTKNPDSKTKTRESCYLDHVVEDEVGQDHDGVRADPGAAVLQAVVDAGVPRLESVREPERKISEGNDDVGPHLCVCV